MRLIEFSNQSVSFADCKAILLMLRWRAISSSKYISIEMSSINCKFFLKIFSAYFTTNMHFHIHHICFCPTTPNPPVTAGFFL